MKLLLPIGLLISSMAAPALAQNAGMSLIGSVQSESQQPLPGAAITVIHMPTGVRHAAASDGSGHFAVPNLTMGGPYIIQVGEGGYRSQTVENVFLENGKTASFTVTLNRLGNGKATTSNRNHSPAAPASNGTLALAPEAKVGGPVLLTTLSGQHQSATPTPTTPPAASVAASVPTTLVTAEPLPARTARYPHRTGPVRVSDPIVPGHYDAKTGNYVYETGTATTLKLNNGASITGVGINSTESNLYRFLSDAQMQVDTVDLTRGWYNFDRVYFEAGKATLTAASLNQLRNVATLLRAYPTARIKLGGYTDDTGTYKVNKALSEARARTAWASLVEMGISPSRVDARGYGPNYSVSSNATEEGRAMNRRLSVKVLQK
ncbi:OmpA family protein [Hymenobacter negativus]|uniref:OmpA family protein n=1 Tax=Hymenobacter negativus TaxID=2795026 RepID=A0ABS3QC33_9BACT|nr:OmpA family protein [Hymenobacter negativus]MBO2008394.1 OmpA family protein [Hymenobacter negativus]